MGWWWKKAEEPRRSPEADIRPDQWTPAAWIPEKAAESLEALRQYAEKNAATAIGWYYSKKPFKAWISRVLRFVTIACVAAGGMMPVLVSAGLIPAADTPAAQLRYSQLGYVLVASGAALFWLDKTFSASTAWMRYVITATALTTAVEQFRMDWAKEMARLGGKAPEGDNLERLIIRITEFSLAIRGLVEGETKAWMVEFQQNLMELEKRTESAIQTARAKMETLEQAAASERQAHCPGAIELTVENVLDTDAGYSVAINGKAVKENIRTRTCGLPGVQPGLPEISVAAHIGGNPAHDSKFVPVEPGKAAKARFTLAEAKSTAGNPCVAGKP